MLQRLVVPLLAVALGLVVAAPALAQEPLVKVARDPSLGPILVDSKGMVLYLYSRDEKGVSNCYKATSMCETNWPILRPPASGAPTGSSDINGKLGVIDPHGRHQAGDVQRHPAVLLRPATRPPARPRARPSVASGGFCPRASARSPRPSPSRRRPRPRPLRRQRLRPPHRRLLRPRSRPPAPAPAAQPAAPAQAPAKPAAAAAPAQAPKPAASPAALPRTGSVPFDPMGLSVTVGAAGVALTAVGAVLLRRRGRRQP